MRSAVCPGMVYAYDHRPPNGMPPSWPHHGLGAAEVASLTREYMGTRRFRAWKGRPKPQSRHELMTDRPRGCDVRMRKRGSVASAGNLRGRRERGYGPQTILPMARISAPGGHVHARSSGSCGPCPMILGLPRALAQVPASPPARGPQLREGDEVRLTPGPVQGRQRPSDGLKARSSEF